MQLALTGATIYTAPGDAPIGGGVVLTDGSTIAAVGRSNEVQIPAGADIVDCSGCSIMAGFWNSHVHFFERKWTNADALPAAELARQLKAFARYGFTSVFDLSSSWENTCRIRARIESGEVAGPAIRSTGEGLVPPDALPSDDVMRVMGVAKTPLPEIADDEQAVAACRKLIDAGADGIKLFVSSQRGTALPQSAMEAAVRAAHAAGKPVFAHPNTAADVIAASNAGVDVIAHTTPTSGPWDESVLAALAESRSALTPTMTLWKYFMRHDRISVQESIVETSAAQLRMFCARGGTVLFGTDWGAVDPDPTDEYELMKRGGMSFEHILASLTTAPAERFGVEQRFGRLAEGLDADLVVIDGDPQRDVSQLAHVRCTIRAGKIVYRASEAYLPT